MRDKKSLWIALALAWLTLPPACKNATETSQGASAATAASTTKTATHASNGALRCGNFLSKGEVAALGLDSTLYNEDETQTTPGMGVTCHMGAIGVGFFHAAAFEGIRMGSEAAIKQGTLKHLEGPAVGSESHWTGGIGRYRTLSFVGSNKQFAAVVAGEDAALVEKVARAVDAKM
jgi:hypothetical protein